MSQDPFEIIVAPYDVYIAAVGTAFPTTPGDAPSGSWTLLGRQGAERYTEDGVMVQLSQTLSYVRAAKMTGPVKAIRTEEDCIISFTLIDLRPAQFTYALAGTSPTSASGIETLNLYRGLDVAQWALLIRGDSPTNATGESWKADYRITRAVQASSPQIQYHKGGAAGVAFEFRAIVDPNSTELERFGRIVYDVST